MNVYVLGLMNSDENILNLISLYSLKLQKLIKFVAGIKGGSVIKFI